VTLDALVNAMGANITFPNGGRGSVVFYLATTPSGTETAVTGCTGAVGAALPLTTFTGAPDFNNIATCTGSSVLNALAKNTTVYITAVFSGDDVNEPSTSAQFTLTTS
jgi:hypothetical protein